LSRALGAHVWPNVYATGASGTPLDFHFDLHEVFALQCEGCKEWRVSKLRIDRPLDHPALAARVRQTLADRRAEAMAETLLTFTAEPGDLLYLPRGQFHNARTASGRSLHVTFGIAPLSGIDVVETLVELALEDAEFRDWLPVRPEDATGALRRAHVARLAARLADAMADEALLARLDARLARRIARSAGPGGDG
jgi:ribosomal protein L16 Arg81 hydroxylase